MNDAPDSIKILGEHRCGETLDVACHRFVDFVSHGTTLEECVINIRGAARGVVFHGATLRECTIKAKKPFTGFSWHDVVLDRCIFEGPFKGCDFGPRPDAYPDGPKGDVSACDFSSATVSGRFFNSPTAEMIWPRWPCFTILDPERNAEDWLSIPFPESYRRIEQQLIVEAVPDWRVNGVVAACANASEIAKTHHVD